MPRDEQVRVCGVRPAIAPVVQPVEDDLVGQVVERADVPACPGHGRWKTTTMTLELFVSLACQERIVWADLSTTGVANREKPVDARAHDFAGRWSWTSPIYLTRAAAISKAQLDTDKAVAEARAMLLRERDAKTQQRKTVVEQIERDKQRHAANRAALRECRGPRRPPAAGR